MYYLVTDGSREQHGLSVCISICIIVVLYMYYLVTHSSRKHHGLSVCI